GGGGSRCRRRTPPPATRRRRPSAGTPWSVRRRGTSYGADNVVARVGVELQLDEAAAVRRPAELQEAAVAELLLREVGLPLADLVLQPGQMLLAGSGKVADDLGEQLERLGLRLGSLGDADDRVPLGRPFAELDDTPGSQIGEELPEAAIAVVGFREGGVLAQQRPLQGRGQDVVAGGPLQSAQSPDDERLQRLRPFGAVVGLLGRLLGRSRLDHPRLDSFQVLVEEELVASGRQELRSGG